jgi:hypothetical protein
VHDPDFGLRWENGLRVAAGEAEMMSRAHMEVIEIT